MIEALSFKTQARTVDHLGREQIADCPTAISELWKNAYDAYARSVSLHIFADEEPVAAIFDDGHGMSYDEFVNRWLVVGTESKYASGDTPEADRFGLPLRTKQGQKGIGRLSSANLGPLLLLVSKRAATDFVAALIDWRIFENPYLVLSDIELPVTQFQNKTELFKRLPELFNALTDNVWCESEDEKRSQRLKTAWETYDAFALENDPDACKPSEVIVQTAIEACFSERHIEKWDVWSGNSNHGTALLVSELNYDLRAQLPGIEADGMVDRVREGFVSTLQGFTDPYVSADANETNATTPDFDYSVKTWISSDQDKVLLSNRVFGVDRADTLEMEHVLSGNIDADGVFHGAVKVFGEWRADGDEYVIKPPKDYVPPKGPTTFVGPIGLHLSTYEITRNNSTHSDEQHENLDRLAENYTGFLIYRDGLRVLPYGRVDNDFFGIEERRSKQAGREFWNARRMFGRIALSREANPNLRDKAGREGFIDNRAAKALRTLVVHILMTAARDYFGLASDIRQTELSDIKERNQRDRAEAERKALAKRNRKKFQSRLKKNLPAVALLHDRVHEYASTLSIETVSDIEELQEQISALDDELSALRFSGVPSKLGSAEDNYRAFRNTFVDTQNALKELQAVRAAAIARIAPPKPHEIAEKELRRLAGQLHAKLRGYRKEIDAIQESEAGRITNLYELRTKLFDEEASPYIEHVRQGRMELDAALNEMNDLKARLDYENADMFEAYLDTIRLLSENINLELIARQGTADNIELRDELNRLHQVAQLGITVEILGHELNTTTRTMKSGLESLKDAGSPPGTDQVNHGFESLTQQLEFLSPLQVSGPRTRRPITGGEILSYLQSFFETVFSNRDINLISDGTFERFSVEDQPSRLLPVFINLVNNSIYWLVNSQAPQPTIQLSVVDEKVVISDNGPGVDEMDLPNIFKMFFTRKVSGGRGIGLYLCRVNLLANGHHIKYADEKELEVLSGANFVIEFKGATFD